MASFVSLRGDENSGWTVVQKSFPEVSGSSIQSSANIKALSQSFAEKKVAEVAAVQIAQNKNIPYVGGNPRVFTVTPFCGGFIPVSMTATGAVYGKGTYSANFETIMREAQAKATSKNAVFIAPNSI